MGTFPAEVRVPCRANVRYDLHQVRVWTGIGVRVWVGFGGVVGGKAYQVCVIIF